MTTKLHAWAPHWPYPKLIAHRGAGKLAPENTLAAFRLGARLGFQMFECDVTLSADRVPFLLHDTDLARTTNGRGRAGDALWQTLSRLDAGAWHSEAFAGEALPCLVDLAAWIQSQGLMVNLEIKTSPGREAETGEVVAQEAARLWQGHATPPLLSSFSLEALQMAKNAAPHLPRALLLDQLHEDWLNDALALSCVAVVIHHPLVCATVIDQAHQAGLRVWSYTVNDPALAQALWQAGVDGLITDALSSML